MEYDRATSTSILSGAGRLTEARALALWAHTPGGDLELVADWRLDHEFMRVMRDSWPTCRTELRAGRHCLPRPDALLLPLLAPGGLLMGVLQYVGALPLESARQAVLDDATQDLVEALLLAQSCEEPPPQDGARPHSFKALLTVDIEGSVDQVRRRAYRRLVTRCGGSVSSAAHALTLVRSGFYERLNDCGIFNLKRRPRDA